jgi:phosphatidylglycerophosphate synthase
MTTELHTVCAAAQGTSTAASPPATGGRHVRHHASVLAAAEKRALIWLAHRIPRRVNSDHLSALGLGAMLGAGVAFWQAAWHPALALPAVVVCLAINWFGDSLDGTLARVRGCQRPRYGYYVDHIIDLLGAAFLIAGLSLSGYMSPLVGLSLLSAYLLVSAECYLATHARGVFTMAFLGIGPTELRIILAAGALFLLHGSTVTPFGLGPWRLFDVGGVIAATALAVTFVVTAAGNIRALYREEPLR